MSKAQMLRPPLEKEENERQQKLLDAVLKPDARLDRADVQQLVVIKKEVPSEHHEWSPSLDQEEPHIKQEQEELCISKEGEQHQGLEEADTTKLLFTPVPVKSEEDGEKPQSSQLHQRQTEQMEIGAGGEDWGRQEPVMKPDPDTHLQPEIEVKTKNSDYHCEKNREPQLDSKSLKTHEVSKSNIVCKTRDKSFSCSECGKSFGLNQNLKIHMRTHTGEKPFSCSVCDKRFSQKVHVTKHMTLHNEERKFSCSVCGNSFTQRGHLTQHMLVHTGEKPFSCSNCDQRFSWSMQLLYHPCTGRQPSQLHGNQAEEKEEAKPRASSSAEQMEVGADGQDCGEPDPASNSHPESLLQPETEDKTKDCSETKGRGEKAFSCSECGKTFNINGTLKRHMRTHTGDKPYSCSVCGKGFTQMVHMKKHMVVHTGNKPFGCSVCGKMFSFDANLIKHMKIHTGEKRFSCPFCGKKFIEKSKVTQHMVIHTGEKPFSCSVCDQSFTWNKQLKTHKCVGPLSSHHHQNQTEETTEKTEDSSES